LSYVPACGHASIAHLASQKDTQRTM